MVRVLERQLGSFRFGVAQRWCGLVRSPKMNTSARNRLARRHGTPGDCRHHSGGFARHHNVHAVRRLVRVRSAPKNWRGATSWYRACVTQRPVRCFVIPEIRDTVLFLGCLYDDGASSNNHKEMQRTRAFQRRFRFWHGGLLALPGKSLDKRMVLPFYQHK